jgi:hypothetical protein
MTPPEQLGFDPDGERGVSEVVSFLLIFALLIGVSITGAVFGIDTLETASRGDTIHLAERSHELLRADMYDLSSGAAYRSTEVDMAGGALRYTDPITITVTAESSTGTMEPITIHPRPIVIGSGVYELLFVAGAIVLQQPDGGVHKAGPVVRIEHDQAILLFLNTTRGDGPESVGGSGTAAIVSYRWDERVHRYEPTDEDGDPVEATVSMAVETPRTAQWRSFFESDPRFENVTVSESPRSVRAEFATRRLYIKTTDVAVRFDV